MGAFRNIILSFYSRNFYYTLARESKGIGMGSIALLTLLMVSFLFLSFVQAYPQLHQTAEQIPAIASTLPAITFKDGKLSIDKPVPYRVNWGSPPDNICVIIDTNYKIGDINTLTQFMQKNNVVLLLTADKAVTMKDKNGRLEVSELGQKPFTITHDNWHTLAETIKNWGSVILLVFMIVTMLIGTFIYNLLAAFIAGVVVLILGWILRADFDYVIAVRLAAAARIPITIITTIPLAIGVAFPVVIAWIIWCAYLIFAVFASKRQNAA
jgi:hypothetical protein